MASIYKITNQINGKIYIGETTRTINARWSQHKARAKLPEYTEYLYNAIKKYGIENFSIEELEKCSDEERFKIETEYIIKYRSYVGFEDCNGYNLILSQDGITLVKQQEILDYWKKDLTIIQISELTHLNVKTISQILKNNNVTQEDIYKRRAESVRIRSSKSVVQYTLSGEYIAEFSSASEAGRSLNKSHGQIAKACIGKYALTAYGYIWQYKEDDNVEEIVSNLLKHSKIGKNQKRIQQLDLFKNFIKEYESASAAGRAFGKNHSAFAKAARDGNIAYGYYWKYIE